MPGLLLAPEIVAEMESPRVKKSKKAKAESPDTVLEVVEQKKTKKEKKKKAETEELAVESPKSEKKSKKRKQTEETSEEEAVVEKKAKGEDGEAVPKKKKKKVVENAEAEKEEESDSPLKEPVPADDPNHLSHFKISKEVVAKLKTKGIEALFPIQAKTFDIVLDGTDLVGRARTGQVSLVPLPTFSCNVDLSFNDVGLLILLA